MFFHARQFPFRNERAIWKLYKSVDEAEIGSQLKPAPTLRHHVFVKLSFNEKFFFRNSEYNSKIKTEIYTLDLYSNCHGCLLSP